MLRFLPRGVPRYVGSEVVARARGLCAASEGQGQLPDIGRVGSVSRVGEVAEHASTGKAERMLVRECDAELQKYTLGVEGYDKGLVLLSGVRGSGKSTSLRAAVSLARSKGYVCLYIPDAHVWTRGGGFFAPVRGEEGSKDDSLPVKWYERPNQMGEVLRTLDECHGEVLSGVECGEYGSVRDAIGQALRDLSSLDDDWRLYPRRAGAAFQAILSALAADEGVQFMLAVDGYEAFAGLTELGARGRYIHANTIPLVGRYLGRNALERYSQGMKNGLVVLACGSSVMGRTVRRSRVEGTTEFEVDEAMRGDSNGAEYLRELFDSNSPRAGTGYVQYETFTLNDLKKLYSMHGGVTKGLGKKEEELLQRVAFLSGGRGDEFQRLTAKI